MGLGHSPAIVSEGLVFYFDPINPRSYAGTGLTGYNLIDTSINGSFLNGPVYDAANKGSIYFDGVDDYIDFGSSTIFKLLDNFTLSVWVKSSVYGDRAILGNFGPSTDYSGFNLNIQPSNKFAFLTGSAATATYLYSNDTFALNTWYHLTAVRQNGTNYLYVNGAVQSSTNTQVVKYSNQNFYFAKWYSNLTGFYHNGQIASAAFYNRALSSTEVLQNYNATKKRFSPEENILTNGLVLYLDAGNARSYAGTGNTAYSISGIGYTGTLVNGSAFSSSNGGAFVLDGTNDFISAPIDASLFSTEATMIIWLKNLNATPAAAANSGFLGYGQGQVNDHYPYVNGVAYLSTFRNIRIEAIPLSSTINRAMPHMVTVTTNSTNWRLYQNTTLQYTDTSVGTVYLSRYTIGYSIDNFFYQGNVYAFMIYNRALTASEIEQNYNALKGRYGLS